MNLNRLETDMVWRPTISCQYWRKHWTNWINHTCSTATNVTDVTNVTNVTNTTPITGNPINNWLMVLSFTITLIHSINYRFICHVIIEMSHRHGLKSIQSLTRIKLKLNLPWFNLPRTNLPIECNGVEWHQLNHLNEIKLNEWQN